MIREECTKAIVYADEICFILQFEDKIDKDKLYMQAKLEDARFKDYWVEPCDVKEVYFAKDRYRLNMGCFCKLADFNKIIEKGFLNGNLKKNFNYVLRNSVIDEMVNNYCIDFKKRCQETYKKVEQKDAVSVELLEVTTKDINVEVRKLSEFDFETNSLYATHYLKDASNTIEVKVRVELK